VFVWSVYEQVQSQREQCMMGMIVQPHHTYVIRMLCISWKMADPQTTNMKSPSSHGPTGNFSSSCFNDLGTFPLLATFLLCFSLASRIFCLGAMIPVLCAAGYTSLCPLNQTPCPRVYPARCTLQCTSGGMLQGSGRGWNKFVHDNGKINTSYNTDTFSDVQPLWNIGHVRIVFKKRKRKTRVKIKQKVIIN